MRILWRPDATSAPRELEQRFTTSSIIIQPDDDPKHELRIELRGDVVHVKALDGNLVVLPHSANAITVHAASEFDPDERTANR